VLTIATILKAYLRSFRKLIFYFLLFTVSSNSFSQNSNANKPISGNYSNQSLKEVLADISAKTNIRFSYSPKKVPETTPITASFSNVALSDALEEIFTGLPVKYEWVDDYIVLKRGAAEGPELKEETEKPVTLSGYIKDNQTSEFLIGATVYIRDIQKGTATNNYGYFSLTLPPNKYATEISYLGYEKLEQTIDLQSNVKLDFSMSFLPQKLEEVVVSSFRTEEIVHKMRASQTRMSPSFVERKPSLMGESDVIKSLEFQPGISFYGDGSSYFHVRGGNFDQNLILLDEATLFNPSHMLGIFSPIIPDAIRSVDIYKADYPVNYGGRLSSVIDIHTRDGNKNKFSGSLNLGFISARGTIEGPIKKDASSYFISFRKSYFDNFMKPFIPNLQGLYFYDFTAKVNLKLGAKDRMFLTIYNGSDVLRGKLNTDDSNGLNWANKSFTLRWNHVFGSRVFLNSSLYSSSYDYYLYGSVKQKDYWNSRIENSNLKEELTYFVNPQTTWRLGFKLSYYHFNPGNYTNHLASNNIQVSPVNSFETSVYAGAEKEISPWLTLNYGIRFTSWTNYGKAFVVQYDSLYRATEVKTYKENEPYYFHTSLEPRFSAAFKTGKTSSVKTSYSRTNQYLNLITNSISPFNSLEVWLPAGPNIKPQFADIVDIGFIKSFPKHLISIQSDIFYKWMYNQIGYKYHANMLVNPAIEGELRQGKGWSYGFELSIKKETGKLTGQASYTFSRSFLQINDLNGNRQFPATYDRPHNFNTSLAYQHKPRWLFSVDYCLASGNRVTTPTSFYYYQGYQVPLYTEQNNDRLPIYSRYDFSVSHQLNKKPGNFSHSITFSILNVFGKRNPIFLYFNKSKAEDGKLVVPMDRINQQDLTSTMRYTYSAVPSLTYQMKF